MAITTPGMSFGDFAIKDGRLQVGVKTPMGLDMGKLLEAQQEIASVDINRAKDTIDLSAKKIAAYDQLIEKKATLQGLIDQLRGPNRFDDAASIFDAKGVGSTVSAVATVNMVDASVANIENFSLTVAQLATCDSLQLSKFTAPTTLISQAGSLVLNGHSYTIDGTTTTYQSLQASINAVKDTTRVCAKIIELSPGSYEMRLEALDMGTPINFVAGSDAAVLTNLGLSAQTPQANLQCKLYLNNVTTSPILRNTNVITDLEPGLNIYAESLGTTQIAVFRDAASISTTIHSFIDAYNDLMKTATELSERSASDDYDTQIKESAVLSDSFALRDLLSNCKQTMDTMVPMGLTPPAGSIQFLNNLGISWNPKDGTLVIDKPDIFNNAVNNQPNALRAFFEFKPQSTNSNFEFLGGPSILPASLAGKTVTVTYTNTAGVYTATFDVGSGPIAAVVDPKTPDIIRGAVGTDFANFTVLMSGVKPAAGQSVTTQFVSIAQGVASTLNTALNNIFYQASDTQMGSLMWEKTNLIDQTQRTKESLDVLEENMRYKMESLRQKYELLTERMVRAQQISRQLEAMRVEMMAASA